MKWIYSLLGTIFFLLSVGGVWRDLIAEIVLMPFEPYIRPRAEQLLPFIIEKVQVLSGQIQLLAEKIRLPPILGEQLRLVPEYIADRNIKRVIRYASSGEIDGTSLVMVLLVLMLFIGLFILMGFQFDAQRKRLIENDNPMKLLPKILFVAFSVILISISTIGWYELGLAGVAVRVNKIFARNLAIIAPYISEHEEKELKSKYALMKTRQDVQAIDARMLKVMRENGIPVDESPASEPSAKEESAVP